VVVEGACSHTNPVSLSRTAAPLNTHVNLEELHESGPSFAGSTWSQDGGVCSSVCMVGLGGAAGSKAPASTSAPMALIDSKTHPTTRKRFRVPAIMFFDHIGSFLFLQSLQS
jgi:hypothetical protein